MGACRDCRWWHNEHASRGQCRLGPPIVTPNHVMYSSSESVTTGPMTLWPVTRPDDWCGQHQAKEPDVHG
jgi:hypothetical protein